MTLDTSKTCAHCEKTYRPRRLNQEKYCSKRCRRAAKYQRSKLTEQPVPKPDLPIRPDVAADGAFAGFSPEEVRLGDVRAEQLFAELGRRDSTRAEIESLVRKELILRRFEIDYQKKRLNGGTPDDGSLVEIKRLEQSIVRLKADLGLSYSAIEKRGTVNTTPACLISAYADEVARMSPETKAKMDREEAEVLARMRERIQTLLDASVTYFAADKSEVHETDPVVNLPEPSAPAATAAVPPNAEAQRRLDEEATLRAQIPRDEPPGWVPF